VTKGKKGKLVAVLLGLSMVTIGSPLLAASGGLDTLTATDIVSKIGNIIKLIAGILGVVVTSLGFLIGGVKSLNGADDAMKYIKGGAIGGFLCFAAWGIAKLLMGQIGG
jgi:hypothetical protein